jgi:pyruvate/2-oxoglutarate dehydrogenase complex dihydrolipoamide acyltransferase (E2) component
MTDARRRVRLRAAALAGVLATLTTPAFAAEKALLDILLGNGVITQAQYDQLMGKAELTSEDILGVPAPAAQTAAAPAAAPAPAPAAPEAAASALPEEDSEAEDRLVGRIAKRVADELPVKASYGSKGLRFESSDGRCNGALSCAIPIRTKAIRGSWRTSRPRIRARSKRGVCV